MLLTLLHPAPLLQVYPELSDASQACLPASSFFTCSSDNTIRLWNTDSAARNRNFYSNVSSRAHELGKSAVTVVVLPPLNHILAVFQDLQRILYVGENTQHLQGDGEKSEADSKAGIRVLGISPDGQHLAAGDRCGNLR